MRGGKKNNMLVSLFCSLSNAEPHAGQVDIKTGATPLESRPFKLQLVVRSTLVAKALNK